MNPPSLPPHKINLGNESSSRNSNSSRKPNSPEGPDQRHYGEPHSLPGTSHPVPSHDFPLHNLDVSKNSFTKSLPNTTPQDKPLFGQDNEFTTNITRKLKTYLRTPGRLDEMRKKYQIYINPYKPEQVDDLVEKVVGQFPEKFAAGGISKSEENLTDKKMRLDEKHDIQMGRGKESKEKSKLRKFMKGIGL